MRTSRTASVLGAALVAVVALSTPAAANVAVGSPTVDSGGGDLRPMSTSATAAVLTRNADGSRNLAYACHANAAGDVVALNVRCVIRINGSNVSEAETTLPAAGAAASTAANAVISAPPGYYEVCWRATAFYINGDRKDLNSRCAAVTPLV